jgi:transcriptional regulator with XRE-family HTH domain
MEPSEDRNSSEDGATVEYNQRVGERLRSIRLQRGMSLQDVHRVTEGEFKAAVLGAYERGERSVSLPRLQRLAGYYEVPVSQMLPDDDDVVAPTPGVAEGVTIDLTKVESIDGATGEVIDRFLKKIQVQRQDFNGRVLTIRGTDVAMLAMLLDMTGAELVSRIRRSE